MGRLTRLSLLFLLSLGAGLGAICMSGPAQAHPMRSMDYAPEAPAAVHLVAAPTSYTVQPGDFLSTIAPRLNRSWLQLAGWNKLADPNFILVGQVLRIPPTSYVPRVDHITPPAPAPAPVTHTYTPTVRASSTSYSPSSGFEACVIQRESNGEPQVMNASGHWGLYQFSYSTWVANGGAPGDWGHAGPAEQHAVFVRSSPSNWQRYDGC